MRLSNRFLLSSLLFIFWLCLFTGLNSTAMAINFTWTGASTTDWNTPMNWNPSYGYPVSPNDAAIFPKTAKNYNVVIPSTKSPLVLSTLTFNSVYTLTNNGDVTLSSSNNSGITGNSSIINNYYLKFKNTANAGNANITNNDSWSSYLDFYDTASAGAANITNNNHLAFHDNSDAGTASIINKDSLYFNDQAKANNAKIDNTGGYLYMKDMEVGLTIGALYDNSTNPGKVIIGTNDLSLGSDNTDRELYSTFSSYYYYHTPGSLIKVGDGKLSLYGNYNSYSGRAVVDKGTLVVGKDAVLIQSPITVNKEGTLNFVNHAHTSYSIDNSGTLAISDANTLASLNISHDFISRAGSTYQVKIDNLGNSDALYIDGAAILNGGIVNISLLNGQYQTTTPYTILRATTLTGTFENLIQPIGLDGQLSYQGNQVTYQIKGLSANLLKAASTPNQTTMAQQLFAMTAPSSVYNGLMGLTSVHELGIYLDQLSAATYSSQQLAVIEAGNWLDSHMRDQVQQVHKTELKPWLIARESADKMIGFKNTLSGLAYGVETSDQDKLFGVGLAYTHLHGHSINSSEYSQTMGHLYQLGMYAHQRLADYLFGVTFNLGTLANMDAKRWIEQEIARGRYHGSLLSAQAETSYLGIQLNQSIHLQPLLGAYYQQFNRSGFAEQSDTGNELNVSGSHYKRFSSQLGLNFNANSIENAKSFVQTTWEHNFANTGNGFNASFESASSSFHINNPEIGRDALVVKAGVSVNQERAWSLSVSYEGRFAKHLTENAAKLQLGYAFI